MAPEIDRRQAQAELESIAAGIAAAFPADHAGYRIEVSDLRFVGSTSRPLYFFLGAAVLVLALSCINAANLLLARALRRRREFAVRGALGGGRAALIRQLVVESALLAVERGGGTDAVTVGAAAVRPPRIPEDYLMRGGHFALDLRVAGFVLLVSGVTTLSLSLAPLLFSRRLDLNAVLGQGARSSSASVRQVRARNALLTGQLTMTLVLMATAGLFVTSFMRLTHVALGFTPEALAAGTFRSREHGMTPTRRCESSRRGCSSARARCRACPTRRLAARSRSAAGRWSSSSPPIARVRRPTASPRRSSGAVDPGTSARSGSVSSVAGRSPRRIFSGAPRVAIVNEYLASLLFPGESAVGRASS